MKDKVIQTAGKTWRVLGEHGPMSVTQLTRTLKEKSETVNQAIGWLAREDKIKYIIEAGKSLVTLVDSEKQIYKILKDTPLPAKKQ